MLLTYKFILVLSATFRDKVLLAMKIKCFSLESSNMRKTFVASMYLTIDFVQTKQKINFGVSCWLNIETDILRLNSFVNVLLPVFLCLGRDALYTDLSLAGEGVDQKPVRHRTS